MLDVVICAPSYKRANGVDTLKYLPSTRIYVSNDEYDDYHKNYPESDIVGVDPKHQGNLCRIRNHILDQEMGDNKVVVIIDDDLKKIGYHEQRKQNHLKTEEEVIDFIRKYSELAISWGIGAWGININPDKQVYREYTPFSLTSYIGGPFMAHIKHDIRYDENLPLKEDYDFTLQFLNKYRKILRVNKYFYDTKQAEQAGGCATYRNLERELDQLKLLQKKWGSRIVKQEKLRHSRSHSSTKKRSVDINPIIHVPIRGV